ncbi:MAG: nucleoside phosphorylase [Desulfobulbaceae bacterium]|nr:nucleoside phosphorylase [Desulfobulbaceae bacterium]
MQEEAIINPRREKGEPELPETGLLCVNPGDLRYLAEQAARMGSSRHFLFNSNLHIIPESTAGKRVFLAGPAVGAPMAVMTLEKLIVLGAKRVIVCGWCGSLQSGLAIGDILLPTWGVSEEGTSGHYPIKGRAGSFPPLRETLAGYLRQNNFASQEGLIWTTDAPYRETRVKVEDYAEKSILGVDMEFNALATVAIYRAIELAAVFLVSDEPWRSEWQPGFTNRAFMTKNKQVLKCLLEAVTTK